MNKIALVAVATALIATVAFAQSEADYQGYMKTISAANGSLGKNIAANDAAGAAADAAKLAATFKMVETFWQGRNVADAVEFAQKAGAASMATEAAAKAGNMEETADAAKTIRPNCGGCHMAHREKTDDGFKIKE
jgi:cytochrome c556